MYVCICTGTTERTIRKAVDEGARCLKDVTEQFGVAAQCGECESLAKEIIDTHLLEAAALSEAV